MKKLRDLLSVKIRSTNGGRGKKSCSWRCVFEREKRKGLPLMMLIARDVLLMR